MSNHSCLASDVLLAIVSDDLSVTEFAAAIQHLDDCEVCQRQLEQLTIGESMSVEDLLKNDRSVEEHSDELKRVMDVLVADSSLTKSSPASLDKTDVSFLEPTSKQNFIGRFGEYEVERIAGRGGMGTVLKAWDESLGRWVAIKVLPRDASTSARERFVREGKAAAAIVDDNVVTVFAAQEIRGVPCIVMQYVDGCSLKELLDRQGTLPVQQTIDIARQIASGLAAAHRKGLVHRDIKPANILIDEETGRALLSDFGLVKDRGDSELTHSGTVVGTPKFMSPEQVREKNADARSDLFSLGCVIYAMCTGEPPFDGDSTMEVMQNVCDAQPTPIREKNSQVPDWLATAVSRLTRKDPNDRFQTADELISALTNTGPLANATPTKGGVNWWPILIGALAIIAALYVGSRFGTPVVPAKNEPSFYVASKKASFTKLTEAIAATTNDDIIEIRGEGVISCDQVEPRGKLTITAAKESATTIEMAPRLGPLFDVSSNLVLEGVNLRVATVGDARTNHDEDSVKNNSLILVSGGGKLRLENCNLDLSPQRIGISMRDISTIEMVDSRIAGLQAAAFGWIATPGSRISLDNSTLEIRFGLFVYPEDSENDETAVLEMNRSEWITDVSPQTQFITFRRRPLELPVEEVNDLGSLDVRLASSVFRGEQLMNKRFGKRAPRSVLASWKDENCLFAVDRIYNVFNTARLKNTPPRKDGLQLFTEIWDNELQSARVKAELTDGLRLNWDSIEWLEGEPIDRDSVGPKK